MRPKWEKAFSANEELLSSSIRVVTHSIPFPSSADNLGCIILNYLSLHHLITYILHLPKVCTKRFDKQSFSYPGSKLWSKLPFSVTTIQPVLNFKRALKNCFRNTSYINSIFSVILCCPLLMCVCAVILLSSLFSCSTYLRAANVKAGKPGHMLVFCTVQAS